MTREMTREEAIKHGKELLEIFWGKNRKFVEVATRSLEAWGKIEDEVYQIKHTLNAQNTDYQTGYLCALSVVEGLIAEQLKEVEDVR